MEKTSGGFAVLVALTIVLIFLFTAACTPNILAVSAASPTPTAASNTSIEPSSTQTPTINPQDIEEVKINQNIQDFLNKSGVYTDEAESNRLMTYHDQRIALGWMGEGEDDIEFQGELLGYIISDDYILMAVGFNGTDGLNHVKPMAIPIGFFDYSDGQSDKFPFQFEKLGDWTLLTSHKMNFETSLKDVEERLNTIKGKPVILAFCTALSDDDILKKGVGRFGDKCIPFYKELKNSSHLPIGLMSEIVVETNENIVLQKTKHSLSSDIKIPDINNINDLKKIDILVVPRILRISSNLW